MSPHKLGVGKRVAPLDNQWEKSMLLLEAKG
jgi:hypothetical protein